MQLYASTGQFRLSSRSLRADDDDRDDDDGDNDD